MAAFSTLNLAPALLESVAAQGFDTMTPVQAQSLPPILAGRDVIAQAVTGSGKTAAFGLGVLQALAIETAAVQTLVLCPTRELADQVGQAIRVLATHVPNIKLLTLCGGVPMRPQLASLAHAPHIVVGTPGRVLAHLKRASLDCSRLRTLVLDEADRMLDMGFGEDIDAITARLPGERQTLLFSATWPDAIRGVSRRLQHEPVEVTVAAAQDRPAIAQSFYKIGANDKSEVLCALLSQGATAPDDDPRALVFCNTRAEVARVAQLLSARGFDALALHGERDQRDRDEVLLRFVNHSCAVLVATDVAARGLDIAALSQVISYDIARDVDTHVHRIGRTGRAGASGTAATLCTPGEAYRAERLAEELKTALSWQSPPKLEPVTPLTAPNRTLVIGGGRKDKLRPGDILGALTGEAGLDADVIGQISIQPTRSYVAIARGQAPSALARLRDGRIKGRRFRAHELRGD